MDKKVIMLLAMLATAALCRPMAERVSARRDLMKKELTRSLSELHAELSKPEGVRSINDRQDYQGWMDFGRRSSEE